MERYEIIEELKEIRGLLFEHEIPHYLRPKKSLSKSALIRLIKDRVTMLIEELEKLNGQTKV